MTWHVTGSNFVNYDFVVQDFNFNVIFIFYLECDLVYKKNIILTVNFNFWSNNDLFQWNYLIMAFSEVL